MTAQEGEEGRGGAATAGTYFVRQATGLVRQFSAVDVFTWSIIFFPWLTSWAGIFWVTPDYYQNVNYYASLAVWAVIAVVVVLLYWQLTSVMPRSGGDYVFISRVLSTPLGFVSSFLFFVAILISAGSGSYWAFSEVGTQLSFAGQVLGDKGVQAIGSSITPGVSGSPASLMAAGVAILAIGAALVVVGGRAFRLVVYSFFGYGVFAMLVVMGIFLTSSHASFVSAYGSYFAGGVPKVFSDASALGYSPTESLASLGAVVPLLFVSIGPYPVMQFVGGEIRRPRRSLLYGLVLAEAASIAIWFGLTYMLDHVVGLQFVEAWAVQNGGASGPLSTVPTAFATVLDPSRVVLWLVVVGLFVGNIGWSWLSLVFISRLFLAWSFDRVMPQWLSKVSDRFHTPVNAIVLAAALAVVPMYLLYFTSFISAQVNAIFFYSVVWFLAALSAMVLPFVRRDVYEASTGRRRRGVPPITVLGLVGAALFAYLGYNSVTNPAVGPFQQSAQAVVAAVVLVPVGIYAASYWYHRSRGVDLRLSHSQLPPE
ncbi:MAG: APC family permease [Nitrososphaerota archaeon]|nr:APC family permease [Nitrososphaerota archaeon]MDG6966551.1 APC family permease [Nitrososphaerota archaeon]MDG6978590.1 APC family permease [Nitrososphaerota archaeon]MDG7020963.1 APC family permease [Nitrososphaerota archaeon]